MVSRESVLGMRARMPCCIILGVILLYFVPPPSTLFSLLSNTDLHRQTSLTCLVQDESDEHLTMIVAMEGKELEKALFAAKTTSL